MSKHRYRICRIEGAADRPFKIQIKVEWFSPWRDIGIPVATVLKAQEQIRQYIEAGKPKKMTVVAHYVG